MRWASKAWGDGAICMLLPLSYYRGRKLPGEAENASAGLFESVLRIVERQPLAIFGDAGLFEDAHGKAAFLRLGEVDRDLFASNVQIEAGHFGRALSLGDIAVRLLEIRRDAVAYVCH